MDGTTNDSTDNEGSNDFVDLCVHHESRMILMNLIFFISPILSSNLEHKRKGEKMISKKIN